MPTFTVPAYAVKQALKTVKPACTRGALPVLSGVRLTATDAGVVACCTNLELTVCEPLAGAEVSDAGVMVVPHAALSKLVAKVTARSGETLDVSPDPDVPGAARFRLGPLTLSHAVLPADEWPRVTDTATGPAVTFPVSMVADVLTPALAADPDRPILTGVLFGGGDGGDEIVSSDSFRLQMVRGGPVLDSPLLVPGTAMAEVVKMGGTVAMAAASDGRTVTFTGSTGTRVTARLVDGEYPRYGTLIPLSAPSCYTFTDPADARRAVADLTRFVTDSTPVRILPNPDGGLLFRLVQQDVGILDRAVAGTVDGDPAPLAYNAKYLGEQFDGLEAPVVRLGFTEAHKPAVIVDPRTDGGTRVRLLMPVRT